MSWGHVIAAVLAETPEQRQRREWFEAERAEWWASLSHWQRFKYRAAKWRNLTAGYCWNLWQAICGRDMSV